MAKTRPPFTPEFRYQMVELVRSGRSPEKLAEEFEPTAQSMRNWVAQADLDAGRRSGGLTTADPEELERLRCENGQPVGSRIAFTILGCQTQRRGFSSVSSPPGTLAHTGPAQG